MNARILDKKPGPIMRRYIQNDSQVEPQVWEYGQLHEQKG